MNQLMGGGKKQSHGSSSQSGIMGIAGQFLGGGKPGKQSGGHSSSPAAGIVGALAGSLLGGGKKPNQNQQQTNYSGSTTQGQGQSHGGGFMESVGGMFGGHHQSSSVSQL